MTGAELKILRKSLGLTQQQAGEIMDCSRLTVLRMEKMGKVPRLRAEALLRQKRSCC